MPPPQRRIAGGNIRSTAKSTVVPTSLTDRFLQLFRCGNTSCHLRVVASTCHMYMHMFVMYYVVRSTNT